MNGFFLRAVRMILVAGTIAAPFAANAAEPAENDTDDNQQEVLTTAAVSDADLDSSRGAFVPDTLNLTNVQQEATSHGNVVIGGFTGANIIGSGSFTNTQGLVNVIQNSGNNVVIQSSTVVNMSFK